MKTSIQVPEFFSNDFERPLRHPNPASDSVTRSVERVYWLINETLRDQDDLDWSVGQRRYHSKYENEPYCFSRIENKFYIWAEERGIKSSIAIFKSRYLAADYFVWLVTKGNKKIDWESFLEMEP